MLEEQLRIESKVLTHITAIKRFVYSSSVLDLLQGADPHEFKACPEVLKELSSHVGAGI